MSEFTRLLFEMGTGTLALLLGIVAQRQAGRRAARDVGAGRVTFDSLRLQFDALDAVIEARTESAVRMRREEDDYQAAIRRLLLDIDDLAALADPPANLTEEPTHLGTAAAFVGEALHDAEMMQGERSRVFLSTGATFDGNGWPFSLLIAGNRGRKQITFSSGASQSDIITWIRQWTEFTGVYALQDPVNSDLIRLSSVRKGANHFVAAGLVHGRTHNAFYDENRANPADRQIDFGA